MSLLCMVAHAESFSSGAPSARSSSRQDHAPAQWLVWPPIQQTSWDEIRTTAQEAGDDSRFGDGRVIGEPEFVRKVISRKEAIEIELKKSRENRPDLPSFFEQCLTKHTIMDASDLLRGRKAGRREAREEFCFLACKRYGYSLAEIGAFLGTQPSSVYLRATAATAK